MLTPMQITDETACTLPLTLCRLMPRARVQQTHGEVVAPAGAAPTHHAQHQEGLEEEGRHEKAAANPL